jgi:hypothetical protein
MDGMAQTLIREADKRIQNLAASAQPPQGSGTASGDAPGSPASTPAP